METKISNIAQSRTVRKSKIKLISSILAISFLAISCGGPKGTSNQQVTLKIWKPFTSSQDMDVLISAYQAKHPNVQIEYTKKNIDNYEADLLDALAAGKGPDIFSINNNWLPKYLDKTTPSPDAAFTFKDYKETFVDTVVTDFTKNNKIYGVALNVDSLGLYYNKDLLGSAGIAVPPKTWDELSTDAQKITRQDRTGYFTRSGLAVGLSGNVNRAVDILYLFMLQQGVSPWSSDGLNPTFAQSVSENGNFSTPGQSALDFYTSFANPNSPNYSWNSSGDYSIDAFANGRAAFLYSYSYTRQTLLQKSPNLNFDVAPVPQPDLEKSSVNFANYFGEVVNKQSVNSAWAWDFLKFISSKESLDKYYAQTKLPSSRKDLISLQIQDPDIGVFAHANLTARSFYKPDQNKLDSIISSMIDSVTLRGQSVSDALNQAESQAATLTQVR